MVFGRLLCCFGHPAAENVVTPRQALPDEADPEQLPGVEALGTPSTTSCTTPAGGLKFIFDKDDSGRVIGINNSGSKYATEKPLHIRSTPYEERIERLMQEEQIAVERRRARASAEP